MTSTTLAHGPARAEEKVKLPASPRGRALFTVDWFLNGKPVLNNHDNPGLTLRYGLGC